MTEDGGRLVTAAAISALCRALGPPAGMVNWSVNW
jgi:hypothetical protein